MIAINLWGKQTSIIYNKTLELKLTQFTFYFIFKIINNDVMCYIQQTATLIFLIK